MSLRSPFLTITLSILTCCLLLRSSQAAEEVVFISDAWVREAPPTAKVLAGYMDIKNNSDRDMILIGVESPCFRSVMLHRTEVVDGVATMRHSADIVIAPKASFSLSPGGHHLMLMGKKRPLIADDDVPITLLFKGENPVNITAKVRKFSD